MTSIQIQCFIVAAKAVSFTEAADQLFMTQPTFGRQISSLEKELGFSLFVRGWKSCKLTDAGQIMYDGMSMLSGEFNELHEKALALVNGDGGQVRVGMLEGQLIDDKINEILIAFRQSHPKIKISLNRYSFHSMLEGIRNNELDIGMTLLLDVEHRPEFSCHPIYKISEILHQAHTAHSL